MMTSRADVDDQLIAVLSSFGSEGLDPEGLALSVGFTEKKHIMGRIRNLTALGRIERVPGNGPQKWRVPSVETPADNTTQGNFYTDNFSGENPYQGGNEQHGFGGAPFGGNPPPQMPPNMPPHFQQHFPPRPRGPRPRGFNPRGGGPRNNTRGRGGYYPNFRSPGQQGNSQYPSQQPFTEHKMNNHFDPTQNQGSAMNQGYQNNYSDNNFKQKQQAGKRKMTDNQKVACPGDPRFISYKNSLQEFTQKQHFTVPTYKIGKQDFGYSGSVSLNGIDYSCEGIWKDRKQAEQNAAFSALKALQIIPSSAVFQASVTSQGPSPKKAKISPVITSHKSYLNEFCQRFHLPTPSYETVRSDAGFMSTVVYNKKVYQSSSVQPTKKDAEQNAAQVVLAMLNQCPAPDGANHTLLLGPGEETAAVAVAAVPAPLPEVSAAPAAQVPCSISRKNSLQEYCQKKKMSLPMYETIRGSGGLFISTVALDGGRTFQGNPCKLKKAAEQSAAETALNALSQVPTDTQEVPAEADSAQWF